MTVGTIFLILNNYIIIRILLNKTSDDDNSIFLNNSKYSIPNYYAQQSFKAFNRL